MVESDLYFPADIITGFYNVFVSLFSRKPSCLLITRLRGVIFVTLYSQLSRELTVRVFIFTTMALLRAELSWVTLGTGALMFPVSQVPNWSLGPPPPPVWRYHDKGHGSCDQGDTSPASALVLTIRPWHRYPNTQHHRMIQDRREHLHLRNRIKSKILSLSAAASGRLSFPISARHVEYLRFGTILKL